jgi:hypothetical protein
MSRALVALITAAALLATPAVALAQSAGDEQYTDPFQGGDGGGQEQPAEQPAEQPSAPPPPSEPAEPVEPAPGGNGTAEAAPSAEAAPTAEATQEASPTLPRTGLPVLIIATLGYALLLAGIAIRRKA